MAKGNLNLSIELIISLLLGSGERECRQVGKSMNREELPPISGAAHEISPAIGALTNQWPRRCAWSSAQPAAKKKAAAVKKNAIAAAMSHRGLGACWDVGVEAGSTELVESAEESRSADWEFIMDLLQRPATKVPSVVEVSLGDESCASLSKRAPFISAVMHGDCEKQRSTAGCRDWALRGAAASKHHVAARAKLSTTWLSISAFTVLQQAVEGFSPRRISPVTGIELLLTNGAIIFTR
jgi:hypothetical protein